MDSQSAKRLAPSLWASGCICTTVAACTTRPHLNWTWNPARETRRVMRDRAELENTHWSGYQRPDGRKGIRNLLLVVYTVQCAEFVAHAVARDEPDTHVIGFPGCYDNEYAIRLM